MTGPFAIGKILAVEQQNIHSIKNKYSKYYITSVHENVRLSLSQYK